MPVSYPLDLPGSGLMARLAAQPYPAYPDGIFVSRSTFELTMSPWTPITIGVLYLIMSKTANARLKAKLAAGEKPKDYIKASKLLTNLVLLHNVALSLYSGWTFFHAFTTVVPYLWKGVHQGGVSGLGHAYCTVPTWDPQGLGRLVWLFYISKYYEIVDSIILIAKGRKVSNLQSYHHAGAICAMWSGTRYSASAIFIFALFNSGIHCAMYAVYASSTLRLPFVGIVKKSMTTAQITQLVVGCFIASLYLFIQYSPVAYASGALPSIGDLETLFTNSHQSLRRSLAAYSTGEGNSFAAQLARYVLSAPVTTATHSSNSTGTSASIPAQTTTAMLLRDGLLQATNDRGTVSCCASSGQAFAVVLNVAYLLPLIVLFLRFYMRSYKSMGSRSKTE